MKYFHVALLLSGALALPAIADDDHDVYIGGDIGQTEATLSSPGYPSANISARQLEILGGYHLNKYVAGEMSYRDFGKKNFSVLGAGDSEKATAVQISGKFSLPIDSGFAIYGRLGAAYINAKDDLVGKVNKTKPMAGVGLEFTVNDNVSLTAEWDYFDKISLDAYGDQLKLSAFTLGFDYAF